MHRFYVPQKIDSDNVLISDAGQLHHMRDVLRLKVNDEVTVFDSQGNEAVCLIAGLDKTQATLTVKTRKRSVSQISVTIACAIPKMGKMDDVIDNLTQLGVDAIIPIETERVIVRLDNSKKQDRLERWRRISRSAARQSQRSSIPVIEPVSDFASVISRSQGFDLKLIPSLSGERKHVKEVIASSRPGNILVLIGPEGDFTLQEIELAKNAGFIPVSLGNAVLRVGTAAVAVASYIMFALAD